MTHTQTLFVLLSAILIATAACAHRPAPRKSVPAPAPAASAPAAEPAPALTSQQWTKPGISSAEYRADLESCYTYAQAQVDHDQRIEADTGAAFDSAPSGLGVSDLRSGMTAFEQKNRRVSLYHDCMRAKGYSAR